MQQPHISTRDMGSKKGSKVKRKTKGRNTKTHLCKTSRRALFVSTTHADVVFEAYHAELADPSTRKPGATSLELIEQADKVEGDEDIGQFYATATGRRFVSAEALAAHMKTKEYKRAVKRLKNEPAPHSERDAEMAAGMGAPDNGRG